ncbi:MAG: hypothetical protein A2X64_09260 [Ignavibacteria bacterium GWF2_33_9]|nr:MAG: hypothetical protein A2X64_09260 [Ignavibacteria bacterium GWF2_33_9]
MQKFISEKLNGMPVSIFSTISKLALEYNAVNLGQGFPDFNGPEWIFDFALEAMKEGKNQYAPSVGIHSLKESIAKYQKKYYDIDLNEENILITAGATESLYVTFQALLNKGDEVILFEPYYDSYFADVTLAGGKPKFVTLRKPTFDFDYAELENAITEKTKLIVLNNPHNPTGKVFSKEQLNFIASMAVKHDLMIVSDEVYEFLTFDDVKHTPIVTLPGMKERTVTISSCGKTFGFTGWKIGYAMAEPEIITALNGIHQWTTFAVNTPGQHAMARAFHQLDDYLPEFRMLYQQKRDLVYNALKETSFKPIKPDGSYFMMAEIPAGRFESDIDASMKLIKELGVATIPPSVFYGKSDEGKSMLRICFAKRDETLIEGVKRLKTFGS